MMPGSESVAYCYVIKSGSPTYTPYNNTYTVRRFGASCPAGSVYNTTTGACDSQCETTNGQTILHQHLIKAAVGEPSTEPPGSVCANSCQYTWGFTAPTNVYAYTSGNPPGVFGSFEYKSAGLECTGGEPTRTAPAGPSDTTNPDDTPAPDPDNGCPDGHVWNGTFCSEEPPKVCDPDVEVGGCDDAENPDPENPTDPDDPGDGEGDGEGDDSGEGDGDGGGEGDGTGDGEGDGEGDGDGDGDGESEGEGDGKGDDKCDPATDPNKCVEPGVTGEECDAEISCKGDAVQCAILKQQKQMRCNAEEQANFENKKSDIEGLFQGEEFELKEAEVNAPSFISGAGRFLPSGCPSPESMNLRSSGGRTLQLDYKPLCQAATDMSWLIVAFTAMFCAVYVGRAFGGA